MGVAQLRVRVTNSKTTSYSAICFWLHTLREAAIDNSDDSHF